MVDPFCIEMVLPNIPEHDKNEIRGKPVYSKINSVVYWPSSQFYKSMGL